MVEHGYFAVSSGNLGDGVDFTAGVIEELGSVDVVRRNDSFQSGLNHFHRRGRGHVKIEAIAIDAVTEKLVKQVDILLQANAFVDFKQVLTAHTSAEFGIVKQKIRQFPALLNQVQFRHAAGFAFK